MRSYLKKMKEKAGGMAQVVEHLPSKHEVLISNPIPQENKNKSK
jgi:hypothetical protein